MKYRCPVCRQLAKPTVRRNVAAHLDRIGRDICPMTGQPFDITVSTPR